MPLSDDDYRAIRELQRAVEENTRAVRQLERLLALLLERVEPPRPRGDAEG